MFTVFSPKPKLIEFPDGSSLRWASKESMLYVEGEYMVEAWVDFGSGVFTNKKVLHLSSIEKWSEAPDLASNVIPQEKKEEIEFKIRSVVGSKNLMVEN
jgi:hypothetical protein